ncbi:hypothetical protein LLG10_04085 [bacterium]|nr:hypothetical protein [bacterium]
MDELLCVFDVLKSGFCSFPNEFIIDSQTGQIISRNEIQKNNKKCSNINCKDKKIWNGSFSVNVLLTKNVSFNLTLKQILEKAYIEESQINQISKEKYSITLDFVFTEANKIKIFFDYSKMPAPYVALGDRTPTIDEQLRFWQRDLKNHPIEIPINDSDRLILWNLTNPKFL